MYSGDLIEAGRKRRCGGIRAAMLSGLHFYSLAGVVAWRGLTDRCGETSSCMQACNGRGSSCDGIREERRRQSRRPLTIRRRPASSAAAAIGAAYLERNKVIRQIIEAGFMICRSEMAACERGDAEKREKCAR